MVGITGPTITFTRAVPGPARGVSNVTSDSGMCGMSGLPGRLQADLARRVRLAEDQARIDEVLAQTEQ